LIGYDRATRIADDGLVVDRLRRLSLCLHSTGKKGNGQVKKFFHK
jgi:hypothetical protein